jgi:primosomal protein N' (replication factor Y)
MFGEFGIGTRKLAQELQKLFPEVAKIHVLDGDTDSLETVPNDTNIVIGTFLAAHDLTAIPSWFSPIGLVILTTVDALLAEADFRGSERAWQSVKGLTGFATAVRAVCIVHTVNPEHPFFGYLSRSASYFLTADVAQRQRLGYPPFGRLAVITRKKLPPQMKQGSLVDVAQVVRARFPEVTVWGPLFARGGERVILKAHVLAPALLAWLSTVSDQFSIDADPDIS